MTLDVGAPQRHLHTIRERLGKVLRTPCTSTRTPSDTPKAVEVDPIHTFCLGLRRTCQIKRARGDRGRAGARCTLHLCCQRDVQRQEAVRFLLTRQRSGVCAGLSCGPPCSAPAWAASQSPIASSDMCSSTAGSRVSRYCSLAPARSSPSVAMVPPSQLRATAVVCLIPVTDWLSCYIGLGLECVATNDRTTFSCRVRGALVMPPVGSCHQQQGSVYVP